MTRTLLAALAASALTAGALSAGLVTGGAQAQQQSRSPAEAEPAEPAVQQTLRQNGISNTLTRRYRSSDSEAAQRAREHMRQDDREARAPLQIDEDVVVGMPANAEIEDRRDPSE